MSEVLRPIFIASNSFDRDVYEPVAEHLQARGHEVITYEADKVANGEIDMAIHIGASACRITYDSKILETDNIGAAWLRRPTMFGAKRSGEDTAFRRSIDSERRAAQSIVFDMIPEERWLNSPAATSRAQEKLQQLVLAQSLGFTIPETVVSNQWDTILDKLPPDDIAFKMFSGVLQRTTTSTAAFTKQFSRSDGSIPREALPFPGMAQQFLQKDREWRVTVIDDEVFPVAIYTDDIAKDDWRKHQDTTHVRFVAEPFPSDVAARCKAMLKAYKLHYGAFDFCEDDNALTFLEMNPSGQYYWLETELGLPLSATIADKLSQIATR
jgi:glutathione synthase/RimK-type ligase-like ATP-grasp enzyme